MQKTISDFKELMSLIFAYGFKEAIMLMTNMQQLNYRIADHSADADNMEINSIFHTTTVSNEI